MRKFIVIEGLDGSGKATQAKLLATYFSSRGGEVRLISFPDYDSPSSSLIKMYLNGEFGTKPSDVNAYAASAFYAVDRYSSWKKGWGDGVVIADRYTTSNAIHQCSKLPEERWNEYLSWLFDFEYNKLGIPAPNVVIYLRVDLEVSQKLQAERHHGDLGKEDIHEKDREYLDRCQKAADYCAEHLGWKIVECCGNGTMRSIEDIHKDILSIITSLL